MLAGDGPRVRRGSIRPLSIRRMLAFHVYWTTPIESLVVGRTGSDNPPLLSRLDLVLGRGGRHVSVSPGVSQS